MKLRQVNECLTEAVEELTESKKGSLKKDVRLKNGDVIPKGTKVQIDFREARNDTVALMKTSWRGKSNSDYMKEPLKVRITGLHAMVTGFNKPPSEKRLWKMMDDAVATTPTGKRTEPDGHGPDGSPSWMLVLGLI